MYPTSIQILLDILTKQGFKPTVIDNNEIQWMDDKGDECFIYIHDIAISSNGIAWFQSSNTDQHLVKVFNQGEIFEWTPITYNPSFGCLCIWLSWRKDHLIFIYKEKYNIYVCAIANSKVNYINFHGEEIMINKNLLAYTQYNNIISIIQIPELMALGSISLEKAQQMNLVPKNIQELHTKDLDN